MDMGLFLNFSIHYMNITFCFMETLLKINASIFGEDGADADFINQLLGDQSHGKTEE